MIDDGWAAAATWEARLRTADDVIARAEDDRRAVALVPFSAGPHDISLEVAGAARVQLHQMKPAPHTIDRAEALPALSRFLTNSPDAELVWLSDGTDLNRDDGQHSVTQAAPEEAGAKFVKSLAQTIGQHPITVVSGGVTGARALTATDNASGGLSVKVLRTTTGVAETGSVRALDLKGLPLGETPYAFQAADRETDARFDLPVEIRNDIARLEISGERSAGAVQLLDKRWRRRTIGIVSGASADVAQPLLSSSYYVQRALGPFADVRLTQGESPADAVSIFSIRICRCWC